MVDTTGRRHCLYVAWGFPPARGGGAYRMMTTANTLAAAGWKVTVVACDTDDLGRYTGVDESLADLIDPRVDVVRVPFDLGAAETDLHRYSTLRVRAPKLWNRWRDFAKRWQFPENVYAGWEKPLARAVDRIHREHPVDLTVASGGPFVTFTAARRLFRKHRVPYVIDHRDMWSLQQFTGERNNPPGSRGERTEREILADAGEVWFVNEPIRQWYEEVFPEIVGSTRIVMNGFDREPVAAVRAPDRHDGPVRFGFLGTVTRAVPLAEFLDGWRLAGETSPAVADATAQFYGYLGFYTTPNWAMSNALAKAADTGISYEGSVPKAAVGEVYNTLDALLLVFGGTRFITSGKVFEYMATGRPIVSVHGPDNAVRDVLDGYPLWFPAASLSAEDIAAALTAAAESVRSGHASDPDVWLKCRDHALMFERSAQLAPAVAGLEQLVNARV